MWKLDHLAILPLEFSTAFLMSPTKSLITSIRISASITVVEADLSFQIL